MVCSISKNISNNGKDRQKAKASEPHEVSFTFYMLPVFRKGDFKKNYSTYDLGKIFLLNDLLPTKNKSGFKEKFRQESLDFLLHILQMQVTI